MKNVLLVFGGKSYEHDISIVTASQIFNRTEINDINLIPMYVSRENRMFVYLKNRFDLKDFSGKQGDLNKKNFKEVVFVSSEKSVLFQKSKFGLKEYLRVEYAIICCHGGDGENGRLVSYFDKFGIKSSSGNFEALALCMNKFLFKQTMRGLKIPVVTGFKIDVCDYQNEVCYEKIKLRVKRMGFPLVLKPNSGGSSIGLFVVNDIDEFQEMISDVFEFDNEVIVEKFISGAREFNVAVIGTPSEFYVSEIDEPLKKGEVLSFTDKYLSGDNSVKKSFDSTGSMAVQARRFPAEVSDEVKIAIKNIASKIFKQLNLFGVVRIDFLYLENTNKIFVGEVNSVPGSLAYYFFGKNKILLNDFVLKLIDICDKGLELNKKINSDFVTNVLN